MSPCSSPSISLSLCLSLFLSLYPSVSPCSSPSLSNIAADNSCDLWPLGAWVEWRAGAGETEAAGDDTAGRSRPGRGWSKQGSSVESRGGWHSHQGCQPLPGGDNGPVRHQPDLTWEFEGWELLWIIKLYFWNNLARFRFVVSSKIINVFPKTPKLISMVLCMA